MIGRLLDLASEAISRRGLDAWEAFLVKKRSELVEVAGGRVRRTHSALDWGCGLRGLLEGRAGYASTTRMDGRGFADCADTLISSALCGSSGGALPLPAPGPPKEPFEAYDSSVESLTLERMASLATEAESSAVTGPGRGAQVGECSCRSERGAVAVRNSLGLDVRFRFSRVTLRLAGETRTAAGDAMAPAWAFSHGPSAMDPARLGLDFSRLMAARTSAVPATAGRTTLLLSPRASARLTGLCSFLLNGERAPARAGSSGSSAEALGSSALTLLDDGRLSGGYGSTPFDGEGVATGSHAFIEKGVRKGFAHTAASAARAGSDSTGHALRPDFAFPPRVGFHNLHLAPTLIDPRETLKGLREGLFLEEICEAPTRGGPPDQIALEGWGFRVVRGEVAEPVEGVRIVGRFSDFLLRLAEVGPDLATFPGGLGGATCLLEDVPIGI